MLSVLPYTTTLNSVHSAIETEKENVENENVVYTLQRYLQVAMFLISNLVFGNCLIGVWRNCLVAF